MSSSSSWWSCACGLPHKVAQLVSSMWIAGPAQHQGAGAPLFCIFIAVT